MWSREFIIFKSVLCIFFLSRKILICFKTPSYCHSTVLNSFAIATEGFKRSEYRTTCYFNINLSVTMTTIPFARSLKTKWFQMHSEHCSIAISGCLKCSFSSSGSFGFCQTFGSCLLKRFILIVNGWLLISYDKV